MRHSGSGDRDAGLSEFELIERFFQKRTLHRDDVIVGIGDDGAVLRVPAGVDLVMAVDTLVSGVHFDGDAPADAIGHKALAVNLSDLAAMGAEPAWATVALTMPHADTAWLDGFSSGLLNLAQRYGLEVIGGDTTRGPLTISVQICGTAPGGAAIRRRGARPGDLIYVSGSLGDAGLGLQARRGRILLDPESERFCCERLDRPQPRIKEGIALRGIASAAIDISDGLAGDVAKLLKASDVGATLQLDQIPLSPAVRRHVDASGDWHLPLAFGDDYELCFTVPAQQRDRLDAAAAEFDSPIQCIGSIEHETGLRCIREDASAYILPRDGYDHFREHS